MPVPSPESMRPDPTESGLQTPTVEPSRQERLGSRERQTAESLARLFALYMQEGNQLKARNIGKALEVISDTGDRSSDERIVLAFYDQLAPGEALGAVLDGVLPNHLLPVYLVEGQAQPLGLENFEGRFQRIIDAGDPLTRLLDISSASILGLRKYHDRYPEGNELTSVNRLVGDVLGRIAEAWRDGYGYAISDKDLLKFQRVPLVLRPYIFDLFMTLGKAIESRIGDDPEGSEQEAALRRYYNKALLIFGTYSRFGSNAIEFMSDIHPADPLSSELARDGRAYIFALLYQKLKEEPLLLEIVKQRFASGRESLSPKYDREEMATVSPRFLETFLFREMMVHPGDSLVEELLLVNPEASAGIAGEFISGLHAYSPQAQGLVPEDRFEATVQSYARIVPALCKLPAEALQGKIPIEEVQKEKYWGPLRSMLEHRGVDMSEIESWGEVIRQVQSA